MIGNHRGGYEMKISSVRLFAVFVLSVTIAVGCAWRLAYQRAEKYANQHRWDDAVDECIEVLKKKPDYTEAQILLVKAGKESFDQHAGNITYYLGDENWDAALVEYRRLEELKQKLSQIQLIEPKVIQQLQSEGRATFGFLGVVLQKITPTMAEIKRFPVTEGVLIISVVPGGPADRYLRKGDIVVSVDGEKIRTSSEFLRIVSEHFPGDQVTMSIIRAGKTKSLILTVGNRMEYLEQVPMTFDQLLSFDKVLQERDRVRELAFKTHFKKGKDFLEKGLNRPALEEFDKALELKPDDIEARRAYQEAKERILIRIAVPRFKNLTEYPGLEDFLTSKVLSEAIARKTELIDFIDEDEYDEILKRYRMSLSDLYESSLKLGKLGVVNALFTGSILEITRSEKKSSKEIKVKEHKYRKDPKTGEKQYFTEKKPAKVFTETRYVTAAVSFKVTDVTTGRVAISRTIEKRVRSETRWTNYRGGVVKVQDSYYPMGGVPPSEMWTAILLGTEEIPSDKQPLLSFDSLAKQALKACAEEIAEEVVSHYR